MEEDFKVLRATAEGDFSITSQSKDGQVGALAMCLCVFARSIIFSDGIGRKVI